MYEPRVERLCMGHGWARLPARKCIVAAAASLALVKGACHSSGRQVGAWEEDIFRRPSPRPPPPFAHDACGSTLHVD